MVSVRTLLDFGAATTLQKERLLVRSLRLGFYNISDLLVAHGASYKAAQPLFYRPDSELKEVYQTKIKADLGPWANDFMVNLQFLISSLISH